MFFFGVTKEKANKKLQRAFTTGDFSDAIAAFRKLIAKTPDDHELYNNLGTACLESGLLDESIQAFSAANELCPASMHYNNLGRALLQRKDFSSARAAFEKARQLDAKDPKPWYNLTVLLREQGRAEDSFRELKNFLRVHTTHANGLNDLACHHLDRGQTGDAIRCFAEALDHDPALWTARLNLIRQLCDASRFPEAKPHLEMLAQQGMNVRVHAENGNVAIDLNGAPFYRSGQRW